MTKLLVSACLLGQKVKYDGTDNLQSNHKLLLNFKVITICPELLGGLSIPREPAEIQDKKTGIDVLNNKAKVITIPVKMLLNNL